MEVVHARCAGLDISKKDAKVCVRVAGAGRRKTVETALGLLKLTMPRRVAVFGPMEGASRARVTTSGWGGAGPAGGKPTFPEFSVELGVIMRASQKLRRMLPLSSKVP